LWGFCLTCGSHGDIVLHRQCWYVYESLADHVFLLAAFRAMALKKYERVTRELERRILNSYQVGEELPSESTLAKDFGVSVLTLRRGMETLARNGLIVRRQGKRAVRATKRNRSSLKTVLLISMVSEAFYQEQIAELQKVLYTSGYSTSVYNTVGSGREKLSTEISKSLQSLSFDAVIVLPISDSYEEFKDVFEGVGCPVVFLDTHSSIPANYVAVDLATGAYSALCHLQDIGCRTIRYVGDYRPELDWERTVGVQRFLDEFHPDCAIEEFSLHSMGTINSGYDVVAREFAAGRVPDGILAMNDLCAIGIMMAARQYGIRIPQDVALVGFDNIAKASQTVPPLTTVNQPKDQVAREVVRILDASMAEPSVPVQHHVLLQPHLVVRRSSVGFSAIRESEIGVTDSGSQKSLVEKTKGGNDEDDVIRSA